MPPLFIVAFRRLPLMLSAAEFFTPAAAMPRHDARAPSARLRHAPLAIDSERRRLYAPQAVMPIRAACCATPCLMRHAAAADTPS